MSAKPLSDGLRTTEVRPIASLRLSVFAFLLTVTAHER
jgi:hypothetical protein